MEENLHIVILAAGKGTRMRSKTPKVLHKVAGLSLLEHTLATAKNLQAHSVTVVLSPDQEEIVTLIQKAYPFIQIAFQTAQKGTADAVLAARKFLEKISGTVLILFADTPLLRCETLKELARHLRENQSVVAVLGVEAPDHPAYGRLVCDPHGGVLRIVEMKDATTQEKKITLCNSGLMACRGSSLLPLLEKVSSDNQAGEYYLTDIVSLARGQGDKVTSVTALDAHEVMGINTRCDLAEAEGVMQKRLRDRAMAEGVTLLDPSSVYFSYDTILAEDITVYPHVYFGPGVQVEKDVTIEAFSHLEGASVKAGASVGPYARLRPGTTLEEKSRVGNFVELKKTTLGKGSKASHLSYLGDALIGEGCNIGAGTITCNYDGYKKHQTVLEAGSFVGSNSTLIAPLTVQKGAYVGAGTVLTKGVSADALALSRTPQIERKGGAESLRRRFSQASKKNKDKDKDKDKEIE